MSVSQMSMREKTLRDVTMAAIDFSTVAPLERSVHKRYAAATDRAAAIAAELSGACSHCRHPRIAIPPPAPVSLELPLDDRVLQMQQEIEEFADRLAQEIDPRRIGSIRWLTADNCKITYYEQAISTGVFNRDIQFVEHEHELVRARLHALPADHISKPARALAIIAEFRLLYPYARLLTGTLVAKGDRDGDEVHERTAVGRTCDRSAELAGQTVQFAIDRLRAGARLGRGAASAARAGAQRLGDAACGIASFATSRFNSIVVALRDPAVVLGDRVFIGWE